MPRPDPDKLNRALEAAAREGLTERDFVLLAALCVDQAAQTGFLTETVTGRRVTWSGLHEALEAEAGIEDPYSDECEECLTPFESFDHLTLRHCVECSGPVVKRDWREDRYDALDAARDAHKDRQLREDD